MSIFLIFFFVLVVIVVVIVVVVVVVVDMDFDDRVIVYAIITWNNNLGLNYDFNPKRMRCS